MANFFALWGKLWQKQLGQPLEIGAITMASADRDSQLGGAKLLGSFSRGSLNQRTDRDDLFRFSVSGRSSINLELAGISRKTNADLELYRLVRPFGDAVRSIGKIDFRKLRGSQRSANFQLVGASRRGKNSTEQISTQLNSGEYIVRVSQRQGSPRYQLRLSNTPIFSPPPPTSGGGTTPPPTSGGGTTPPPGGGTTPPPGPPAPIPLTVPTPTPVAGNVSNAKTETTYSFNVGAESDYLFNLSGLTGDADLEILRADRTVVVNSENLGANPEQFIETLTPGNYLVRVYQKATGVNANYQLSVNPLRDQASNQQASATPIVFSGTTPTVRTNYVGSQTKSPFDYYEFTTPSSGSQFLTVEMTGLFNNLGIELYEKPGTSGAAPNPILVDRPGASAESFGGTLSGGKTYIIKILPGADAGTGSTYQINLRLSPTQSRPSVTRDIAFGSAGSNAANLTAAGSLAYFTANDGTGNALWVSDGTLDGTRKLRAFSGIGTSAFVNGTFYFSADDGSRGIELWQSNGTAAGTRIVADERIGGDFNPRQLTVVNNRLYFLGQPTGEAGARALYYLSGDPSDPIKPVIDATNNASVNPQSIANLTAIGNTLYFTGNQRSGTGNELMRIEDADASTTIETIDVYPGGSSSTPQFLTAVGDTLFFQATAPQTTGELETELYRLNADNSLTVFNLPSEPANSQPKNLFEINGTLYFAANAGDGTTQFGEELWALRDAATATGIDAQAPVRVRDINVGSGSSNPSDFVNLNGELYFMADDSTGKSLWRTQTTGTSIIAQKVVNAIRPQLDGVTEIKDLTVVGQGTDARLYFVATRDSDTELWFTNGQVAGTGFFNIDGNTSSNPQQLTDINGRLFFIASAGDRGAELWSFQGLPVPTP